MANLTIIQACARAAKQAYQAAKINTTLEGYVEKEDGKGLSTNDYTTTEKQKLAGIASGANKTVVDSALSGTSTNPVQNKVIYAKVSEIESDIQQVNGLKGSAGGFASLDESGKVPSSQLPSFVDDVVEGYLSGGKVYEESAHTTEITAESGKIYVDLTSSKTYRWSGTAYVVISETIALGETSSTAFRGDKGKIAYDHSQNTTPHITSAERTAWNAKSDFSGDYEDLNGAPVKIWLATPDYDYIMLMDSNNQVVGEPIQMPIVTADHIGFMTPTQLAMLSIDETALDTAVTAALNEASA